MILTGADGYMKIGSSRIGKCRNIRLNISKSTLRSTTLKDFDETYLPALRNTTGTASLFYDPDDQATVDFLNSILTNANTASQVVGIVLSRAKQKTLTMNAILTEVGASVAYGEAQVCEVSFQVSGGVTGGF